MGNGGAPVRPHLHSYEDFEAGGKTYRIEYFERLPDRATAQPVPQRRFYAYVSFADGWVYQCLVCCSLKAARASARKQAKSHASGEIFADQDNRAQAAADAARAILGYLQGRGEVPTMEIAAATKLRRSALSSTLGRMVRRRDIRVRRSGHRMMWSALVGVS